MINYYETKAHPITMKMVLEGYKDIRKNGKAVGVDGVSIETFAKDLQKNLYKIWNRMSSGSYHPKPVREKQIEKAGGKMRSLGIACVEDKIAQSVVKSYLEPKIEPSFHADSYGYRPKRHAHQAIQQTTSRCFKYNWVIDIDIQSFFDCIDHALLEKAVEQYTKDKWALMYIRRWLKSGMLKEDGTFEQKEKGSVQGSVLSPLLANTFLHFVFDKWMAKHYPKVPFERYSDDIIVHCKSKDQALYIKGKISERMKACELELNAEKTKIVFCKNPNQRETHPQVSFSFLGYTFQPRIVPTKNGLLLLTLPAMSIANMKRIGKQIRDMCIHSIPGKIHQLAEKLNAKTRGWMNYYCKFNKYATTGLWSRLNFKLIKWKANQKGWGLRRSHNWLKTVFQKEPDLFAHWAIVRP